MAGITREGPETASPRRLADRGLVDELFQALVGAVLSDDDYYDYSMLNSSASHAGHAITRVSNAQSDRQSDCAYTGAVCVPVFSLRMAERAARNGGAYSVRLTEPGLQRLTETGLDFLAITAAEFQFNAVV